MEGENDDDRLESYPWYKEFKCDKRVCLTGYI